MKKNISIEIIVISSLVLLVLSVLLRDIWPVKCTVITTLTSCIITWFTVINANDER